LHRSSYMGSHIGPKTPRTPHRVVRPRMQELKSALSGLSNVRSEIVDLSKKQLSHVAESKKVLPSPADLQHETTGLGALFQDRPQSISRAKNETSLMESAETTIYLDELTDLCNKTEAKEPLDGLLKAVVSGDADDNSSVTDVKSALELAWTMDQAAILTAREKVLNEVRSLKVFSFRCGN
jgi:prophage DNA circulation protein